MSLKHSLFKLNCVVGSNIIFILMIKRKAKQLAQKLLTTKISAFKIRPVGQ